MNKCKSFSPSINNRSKILILGSMPGVKSLEEQQYYAHPQNRFWEVMGKICKISNLSKMDYKDKLNLLLEHNIALWDTLGFCERDGSLDSNITNEQPNDIRNLLRNYQNVEIICLNGNKSYLDFKKYFPDILEKYECYKMSSTSPANARYSLENLVTQWKVIDLYF